GDVLMSTKNLARTVIEGGRYYANCWFRRRSNKWARAAERSLSSRMTLLDVDDVVYEPRESVGPCFRDKLAPAERWMRSQVGRPWDKVRGDLMQRFNARTTGGRHIVFDHLIPCVQVADVTARFSRHDFKVDRYGFLRGITSKRSRHRLSHLPERESVLVD